MDAATEVKTFRGRSLEEILPQIREELGPDAIVLRRREGLQGGVGGFFQRPYVEVDARGAEPALELRSDRATAEGLASPAVQALFEQATPFADALAAAARQPEFSATVTDEDLGLYGPQPNAEAIRAAAPLTAEPPHDAAFIPAEPLAVASEPPASDEVEAPGFDVPTAPRPVVAAGEPLLGERPAAADAAERRLVASGLSPALAAAVVREAVVHGLPFSSPRHLKKLVRRALAGRIDVLRALGTEPRTLALVGAGGAGKTSAVAHLAASYAAAGASVAVVSLRGDTTLAARLQPLGVAVVAAADGAQAKRRLGAARALVTLVDTPALGLSSPAADVRALAADLKQLGATEVHLALPAPLSAAAAGELAEALAPLGVTHVVLAHADDTRRPGAPIELALEAGRPLSYICTREGVALADPAELAQQLLP